jgi:exonuclease III
MASIHIATLNINGMTSRTRISMLENFLCAWDIDILIDQEVTKHALHDLWGYSTMYNIAAYGRGTAIIDREVITMENLTRLPSGRAIAAEFKECWLINVYAPSETALRHERETFYTSELPHLLTNTSRHLLMAGDFKSTLELGDSTGTLNHCRALTELTRGMELQDAWNRTARRLGYTHYSATGASRLDRIYLTKDLNRRKQGIETTLAAFTDHLAVNLHLDGCTNITDGAWILETRRYTTGGWQYDGPTHDIMGPTATTKTMFSQCPVVVGSILQTSTYTFHATSPSRTP